MKNDWLILGIAAVGLLSLAVLTVGAQSLQPTSPTYTWSGELVAFDEGARMMTVKARAVGQQALQDLPSFKSGDRVVLTWSGFDSYSDGIARVARYEASKKWSEPFTFPVEFVAYDSAHQYMTFKFQPPAASVDAIKKVKPGEWITTTTRHRPASEVDAIVTVNSFVTTSPANATTD